MEVCDKNGKSFVLCWCECVGDKKGKFGVNVCESFSTLSIDGFFVFFAGRKRRHIHIVRKKEKTNTTMETFCRNICFIEELKCLKRHKMKFMRLAFLFFCLRHEPNRLFKFFFFIETLFSSNMFGLQLSELQL
jgi:hypothetical protein